MSRLHTSLHPELTQNAIDKLFKSKIYTVLSFVDTNPEVIVKITGLVIGKVWMIRRSILSRFSSTLRTGYEGYLQLINECAMIPTGINCLDQLLEGGLTTGKMYELCGTSGSGKTTMLMTLAVNVCHLLGNESVLYIDTKNDAYGHKFEDIIEKYESETPKNAGEFMSQIKICNILKWNHLLNFLQQFSRESSSYRLLIIDSVPALYLHFLNDPKNKGIVFLNSLANLLRFIAVEHKMVIIITNVLRVWTSKNKSKKFLTQDIPLLGKYWIHVPNTRLIMKCDNNGKRTLTVAKSADYPIGRSAEFKITKRGVE